MEVDEEDGPVTPDGGTHSDSQEGDFFDDLGLDAKGHKAAAPRLGQQGCV